MTEICSNFNNKDEEIIYLKSVIDKERELHQQRESILKEKLNYALHSSEKISQECDRAVLLAEKMKTIIENFGINVDTTIRTVLIQEMENMKERNREANHRVQKYRSELEEYREKYMGVREELSKLLEEQIISAKKVPGCVRPIISEISKVNVAEPNTIISAVDCVCNTYLNTILDLKKKLEINDMSPQSHVDNKTDSQ